MQRPVHIVTERDFGLNHRRDEVYWRAREVLGRFERCDIGRVIYVDSTGHYSCENNAQREARREEKPDNVMAAEIKVLELIARLTAIQREEIDLMQKLEPALVELQRREALCGQ